MRSEVLAALIIAGAIVVAAAMWLYFSPYHSCVRAQVPSGSDSPGDVEFRCAIALGGRR